MEMGGEQNSQKDFYTNQLRLVFEPFKDWHINLEGSIRTTTHYQHWAVLPVYGYDVAGDPFAIAWDMGYSTYAPGASRVDEYSVEGKLLYYQHLFGLLEEFQQWALF